MRSPSLALAFLSVLALASPARAAEATRILKAELPASVTGRFRVENLAGAMRIVPGAGDQVTAVASVHAESDTLAAMIRFERVSEAGTPTLRVIYPLDEHGTLRYDPKKTDRSFLGLFGGGSTTTKYDGRKVRISGSEGVVMYADVEIRVPSAPSLEAVFRNDVGRLHASGIAGKIRFDSSGGDIDLDHLKGEISADTGSGDVKAADLSGSFSCDTGSGNCTLTSFQGDRLKFDVGSGDVRVGSSQVRQISADTGSGDIRISASDLESFAADTGSGDVVLEGEGGRLAKVTADTGSGDVTLRLAADATFEARADQGSGDIRMEYRDAEAIVERKQVVGYRRGDSRIRIDVSTGSGDLTIGPMR
ncbi:MAG TPA: DUF4097 family beta strand repeat-containing protein [Candidatus Polarisedimenticolia bacterium]|jgi:hypothetical protein|nr:DUF4097 family beta strand repeat-containing protein [Candidatus Polarisedimenticolia bacterium]